MEQLSALDTIFIDAETELSPQHMSAVSIYDPATCNDGYFDIDHVEKLIKTKFLNEIPILTKILVRAPHDLDRPYLKETENFNIDNHIFRIDLDDDVTWEGFCTLVANIHATHLDRREPLWEVYIINNLEKIEGLPAKAFAVYLKLHHAIADGRAMEKIVTSIHTFEQGFDPKTLETQRAPLSDKTSVEKKLEYSGIEFVDTLFELSKFYGMAVQHNIRTTGNIVKLAGTALAAYSKFKLAELTKEVKRLEKAKTIFNQPLSPDRVIDRIHVSLENIKTIRSYKRGLTVNDAALAVVAGALRNYLISLDELPEIPIVACMPVDTRGLENKNSTGNDICLTNLALCTHIEDPLERLCAIGKEAKMSKTFSKAIGEKLTVDVLGALYPALVAKGIKFAFNSGINDYVPPISNTLITNIASVSSPIYMTGAKLIDIFGMGPLVSQLGMMHVVASMDNFLTISFISCPQHLKYPQRYKQFLQTSFDELLQEVTEAKAARAKIEMDTLAKQAGLKKTSVNKGKRKVVTADKNMKEVLSAS